MEKQCRVFAWLVLLTMSSTFVPAGGALAEKPALTASSATELAKSKFTEKTGVTDPVILDSGRRCGDGLCWHQVKVGDKNADKVEIYFLAEDGSAALEGWDEMVRHQATANQKSDKVHPLLRKKIAAKKDPKALISIIIVLREQPNIEELMTSAAEEAAQTPGADEKDYKGMMEVTRGLVSSRAATFNEAHGQTGVATAIESLGGAINLRGSLRNHLIATIPAEAVETIAQMPEVARIEPNLETHGHLDVSVPSIHVDDVWSSYTTGYDNNRFNIDIGIMDSGVGDSTGHPDLTIHIHNNFVSDHENYTYDNQGHGTHVAGITSSNDNTYRGVAYASQLWNLKVAYRNALGGTTGPWDAALDALQTAYDSNLEVVNYSYGWYPPDDGDSYTDNANGSLEVSRALDAYVEAGLTAVISAGNSGPDYATINVPGDAFNVLTVGNMSDQGTISRADDTLWGTSSRGNTGDDRTKPEVAAPGRSITSCDYSTDGFVSMTGTSMAAPHVAGVAALVTDYWAEKYGQRIAGRSSASLLLRGGQLAVRAMIMNMADQTTGENVVSLNDRQTGAGYIDALATMQGLKRTNVIIGDINKDQTLWYSVTAPHGVTLKATVVWNRHVNFGSPWTATEPISDIDLALYDSSGEKVSSTDWDTNWEKIAYTPLSTDHYMIRLRNYGTYSATHSELFALACNFPLTPVGTPRGDFANFDEDEEQDFVVYRPSTGVWYGRDSGGSSLAATQYGKPGAGDIPVPGEWHSGAWYSSCDIGIWRPTTGTWWMPDIGSVAWGASGDVPVPGNYDDDGGTDFAVFRPSDQRWYIKFQPSGNEYVKEWGLETDIPVPSNWPSSAHNYNTDLTVWRPSNGKWYAFEPFSNEVTLNGIQWGTYGDVPVPADYQGDKGRAQMAVFRPWEGRWYIRNKTGTYTRTVAWGTDGDIPAPLDYNRDGKADLCVFRPENGTWYCRQVETPVGALTQSWGTYTDLVVGTHHR